MTPTFAPTSSIPSGALYNLLVKVGVNPGTARTVNHFLLPPTEIILVVLAAIFIAHLGSRYIRKILGRLANQANNYPGFPRSANRMNTVIILVADAWKFLVVIVALGTVLAILGVDLTPLLASATVIGATIGFGAQSLVRDYLSGILLTVEDQYAIGDTIQVGDVSGKVEEISLRVTKIRTSNGTLYFQPNGDIRLVANMSRGWAKAVLEIEVPSEQLDITKEIISDVVNELTHDEYFAEFCSDPPDPLDTVATGPDTVTVRISIRTVPEQKDILEHKLREETLRRLIAAQS